MSKIIVVYDSLYDWKGVYIDNILYFENDFRIEQLADYTPIESINSVWLNDYPKLVEYFETEEYDIWTENLFTEKHKSSEDKKPELDWQTNMPTKPGLYWCARPDRSGVVLRDLRVDAAGKLFDCLEDRGDWGPDGRYLLPRKAYWLKIETPDHPLKL